MKTSFGDNLVFFQGDVRFRDVEYLTILCVKCNFSLKGGNFELILFGQFLQFFGLQFVVSGSSPLLKVFSGFVFVCLTITYKNCGQKMVITRRRS